MKFALLAICIICVAAFKFYHAMTVQTKPVLLPFCLGGKKWSDIYNHGGRTNFTLVMPHIEPTIPCEERDLYMIVVVNSDATEVVHRSMRMAIRKTWGNSTTSHGDYKWRLFFALGLSTDGAFNRHNHHEALQYNDVIIGNFSDTYRNIIIKTFMSHYWAFSKFSCRYVLKTDDDVYVRVSQLSHWLAKADSPLHFYGGFISYQHPVTRTQDQWYISREEFNESVWPPFAYGAFHVLSTDLLPAYFHYTQFRRKPFHTDDAYMGVVARDLGVKAINIPGLCYTNKVCDLKTATGIAHNIDPTKMMKLHLGIPIKRV